MCPRLRDRNGPSPKSNRNVLAPLVCTGMVLLSAAELVVELPELSGTVKFPRLPPGSGSVVIEGTAVPEDDPSAVMLALDVGMADKIVVDGVMIGMDKEEGNDEAAAAVVAPSALPLAASFEVELAWGAGALSGEEFPSQVLYTATYSTSNMFP